MADLETFLRLEANQFNQEQEVERILKLKQLKNKDPLLVLDLNHRVYLTLELNVNEIKKQFRKKSVLVHPDKNKHPLARQAFEELQEAVKQLETKEDIVMNFVRDARDSILHTQGIKLPKGAKKRDYDDILEKYPKLGRLIQLEFVRLAQELEYRDKTRLKNELQREIEINAILAQKQKEKEEYEEKWEESRDDRIKSWKKFTGVTKKKKPKATVLGDIPGVPPIIKKNKK